MPGGNWMRWESSGRNERTVKMDNEKAVLISIRPKWCEQIASGKKTIEVRKTRPKLDTPFRCYVYCTKAAKPFMLQALDSHDFTCGKAYRSTSGGEVIGEFVCDRIYQYTTAEGWKQENDISDEDMETMSCLSQKELFGYENSAEVRENCIYLVGLYGWHISDLKIYDTPKKLSDFATGASTRTISEDGRLIWRGMERPPNSWCYVSRK